MKVIKSEKELQKHIIENFEDIFGFKYVTHEYVLPNGKKIDLIGKDDMNEYIIELKKKSADSKTVWQLFDYINVYKLLPENAGKNIAGIVAAPEINADVYETISRLENITAVQLDNVQYHNERVKFTTTFSTNTMEKLRGLMKYYKFENLNDVIECLVRNAWEEHQNEVDIKHDNKRICDGDSK